MAMKEFESRFLEDESAVRDRMLEHEALDKYRKEPGDYVYDQIQPVAPEIQQLQANQDAILMNSFAQYADGEDLDERLYEVGLPGRFPATPNQRQVAVDAAAGVVVPKGHELTTVILDNEGNPITFSVDEEVIFDVASPLPVDITSLITGEISNVPAGSAFIFQPPIPGVTSIVDMGTTVPGRDRELNEDAYNRLLDRRINPETGGNKHDYNRWVREVSGVGDARVIPRGYGPNTVKVVIVDTNFAPASPEIVAAAQLYLDPGSEGLGEGKAPCGASVTVVAATGLTVNVAASITLAPGSTLSSVTSEFSAVLSDYLTGLVFWDDPENPDAGKIIYNQVSALLMNTAGVNNHSGLTVNGGTVDIVPGADEAPVLGTVTFT